MDELEAMLELETMLELEVTELAELLESPGLSGPHAANRHDTPIKNKLLRMVVYLMCR